MKINKLITIFSSKYILNVLGIIMLVYFLWYRFLRERLPKNIPFELNELGLYIIICICCIYIYILLRIFKPKPPSEIVTKILKFLLKFYTPWFILEETVKSNKYIRKIYPEILIYFPQFLRYYKTVGTAYKVYIVLYIIPRSLLVIIFCIDVFYFHRIEYIYKFSFLILYILICNYIIYSIKKTTEECITYLNTWYVVEVTSEDNDNDDYFVPLSSIDWLECPTSNIDAMFGIFRHRLKIEHFLGLQGSAISYDNTLYSYVGRPRGELVEKFATENNLEYNYVVSNKELNAIILRDFNELMPIVIHLFLAIDNYDFIVKDSRFVKKYNLIIIALYLICWVYILFMSFNMELLGLILNISDKIEPFSGLVV